MRILMGVICVALTLTFALSGKIEKAQAQKSRPDVYLEDENTVRNCNHLNVNYSDRQTYWNEERHTIPASVGQVTLRPSENAGAYIYGGAGADYDVTVCKTAAGRNRADADRILQRVRVSISGGKVAAEGPTFDGDWGVFLIVGAPKGGSIDVETHNGPISFRNFSGRVMARAQNGPISLNDTTGEVRAHTQNGPIHVSGGGGDFQLDAQNGPIDVYLQGSRWDGKQLEGRAHNGPLTLTVPVGYSSGVRVDTSEHSPVRCVAEQCRSAARTWSEPSRIQFGSGAPIVRLSTENGPVTVRSARRSN